MQPPPEVIEQIKAKFPDRVLHLTDAVIEDKDAAGNVTATDGVASFILTGPTADEYKKFTDEVFAAEQVKGDGDRLTAQRGAVYRCAIAMIRWPDRAVVQTMFENRPAMVDGFARLLHQLAGNNVELRSKKL